MHGRLRPPQPSQYDPMSLVRHRGPAKNNYTAPSSKDQMQYLTDLLTRNGYRKMNIGPIRKSELNRVVSDCISILRELQRVRQSNEKSVLYDELMADRQNHKTIWITSREYNDLLEKVDLLDYFEREEVVRAKRRQKQANQRRKASKTKAS